MEPPHDQTHPCAPEPNEAALAVLPLRMLEAHGASVREAIGDERAGAHEVVICATCDRVIGPFYRMGIDRLHKL